MGEATTSLEVTTYYTNKGTYTQVTDPEGNSTDLVGTGCTVEMDGEIYTVVVQGDVNGDAAIDLFDRMDMIDHFNSETEENKLTGAYLDAGRISQEDDIVIFDIFSVIDHLNTEEA